MENNKDTKNVYTESAIFGPNLGVQSKDGNGFVMRDDGWDIDPDGDVRYTMFLKCVPRGPINADHWNTVGGESAFFVEYYDIVNPDGSINHRLKGKNTLFLNMYTRTEHIAPDRTAPSGSFNMGERDMAYAKMYANHVCAADGRGVIYIMPGEGLASLAVDNAVKGVYPNTDNYFTLGRGNKRWTSVYAVNGVIQTSDKNQKENITTLDKHKSVFSTRDCADFVKNLELSTYNFKDKQDGNATQIGFMAQDIVDTPIGDIIIKDKEELNYSLSNYVNVLAAALQNALKRIEELENK